MPTSDCETGPQPSRIPGNIGTLKSKVMVWDNDPFWARATQIMVWPFSAGTEDQSPETFPDIVFQVGSAFLRPTFQHHDMFVYSINHDPNFISDFNDYFPNEFDFVGSTQSGVGQVAKDWLPGGRIYNCSSIDECFDTNGNQVESSNDSTGASIFPHQMWRISGSLIDGDSGRGSEIIIHPSEYGSGFTSIFNIQIEDFSTFQEWDYILSAENGKLSIWPQMVKKQTDKSDRSIHWVLEKSEEVWQGQDFFVTIRLGDNTTDDTEDPGLANLEPLVLTGKYEPYLNYIFDESSGGVEGISNQAFYIKPQVPVPGGLSQEELNNTAFEAGRNKFDWRFKTYILVELGVEGTEHNYFIEFRKGSHPRLLLLGDVWDSPTRLNNGVNANPNDPNNGFEHFRSCREISLYKGVSCDQLFKQKEFQFSLRNHLGRFVITFEGYEGQPWVITRFDNDPTKTDFSKLFTPMVVPKDRVRILGGNISCSVNYSPTEYVGSGTTKFKNRQVDTGPNTGGGVTDKDVFLTFSNMGNTVKYDNSSIKATYFNDPRFLYDKVGYNCDAYVVQEKNKNSDVRIPIYQIYNNQYALYGKGGFTRQERDFVTRTNRRATEEEIEDPSVATDKRFVSINPMQTEEGGSPSELRMFNARDPSQNLPLKLEEATGGHYEWKNYIAIWDIGIELIAGSLNMESSFGDKHLFQNYVTPIVNDWRLIILGGGKSFEGIVEPFNIAPLVSKISDSWSHEDYHSLSHEMQMECYIPIESTDGENPDISSPDESEEELLNTFSLGRKLLSLHDKAFYLTISYWWENGIGHRWVESNLLNSDGDDPNTNDVLIQMTGVAYGAQLTRSNNLLTMSFTVKDYMSIMENQMIFNSPFFDAVQDTQAVYELGKMAGMADVSFGGIGIDRRPLGYLRKVLDDGDRIADRQFIFNGEKSRSERFDLPGTYASLVDPSMKFQNGESYETAMKRIASLSGKAIYFDRWGVLRLETPAALTAALSSANENLDFIPVFDFVSTPIVREGNIPEAGEGGEEEFIFDPTIHAAHLVYNSLTYQRSVEDCVNQIVIMSASNNIKLADGRRVGGLIVEGYTFFDQVWNPEVEGFIGYRKPLYQQQGAFGDVQGVRNAIGIAAKRKFPPVIMSFETYGVPGLKALDIITLDGNLGYITEISHDLDPSTNRWWMNIQAEWLKPHRGELGFLENTEPTTGG